VRLVLVAFLVSSLCSIAVARPLDAPTSHSGTFVVTYWVTAGPDAQRVTAAQYAEAVRSGACGPRSHVMYWPARVGRPAELQLVCEG